MSRQAEGRARFAALIRRPEEEIDLAEAALLIAGEEYPNLDVAAYLSLLAHMGAEARRRVRSSRPAASALEALNHYLFDELGFAGDTENYYDPRNSYLNDVLERRTGIPISLSTVYMTVARHSGLPIRGVGFPGHFLVKFAGEGEEIVLDPFNRGAILTEADCQRLLDQATAGWARFSRELLGATGTKAILARMLGNLKGIYAATRQYAKALACVERILLLTPDAAPEIRDRGLLLAQMQRTEEAVLALTRYLKQSPAPEDAAQVKEQLRTLRMRQALLN
ncbi:MAG: tetratricopeptide repeat protein [candidate division NC10 bacterium]|nr:tetratricopeptide repeat protein [candidate division NC10 bacterium]